jgi:hypothetical protein
LQLLRTERAFVFCIGPFDFFRRAGHGVPREEN